MSFTHLCVRSSYSFLSSTASVQALVARAREDGLARLALTDDTGLHGAVAFARVGVTAIANSPQETLDLYHRFNEVLDQETSALVKI